MRVCVGGDKQQQQHTHTTKQKSAQNKNIYTQSK